MPNVYDLGDEVRTETTFTGDDGQPVDPPVVRLQVIDGNGIESTYAFGDSPVGEVEVTRSSLGTFEAIIVPDVSGIWQYRWEAPDVPGRGAAERIFTVRRSDFT